MIVCQVCGVAQEDIVNAMALTGQVLMGQSVMVKSSEVRRMCSLVRPCCIQ